VHPHLTPTVFIAIFKGQKSKHLPPVRYLKGVLKWNLQTCLLSESSCMNAI
jgi:hypothetical protein